MALKKRALPNVLTAFGFAPLVVPMNIAMDLDGTASRTVPAFKAPFKGRFRSASYMHEVDPVGTSLLVKLRNATKAVDLTADLNVTAIVANGGADFVNATGDLVVNKGDLVTVVSTATAITTGASETSVVALFEWIKD